MTLPLTAVQQAKRGEFQAFVARYVTPCAEQWDRDQRIPDSVIAKLAQCGYLGYTLPEDYGGQGGDVVTFGLLNEAFGRGSSALTGVLTVQAMTSMALLKWGTVEQTRTWLPPLARGEIIGAFALTEPGGGSDLQWLATRFTENSTGFVLKGTKKWISCAQFAAVFLVFGTYGERSVACVVPRKSPGLHVEPI